MPALDYQTGSTKQSPLPWWLPAMQWAGTGCGTAAVLAFQALIGAVKPPSDPAQIIVAVVGIVGGGFLPMFPFGLALWISHRYMAWQLRPHAIARAFIVGLAAATALQAASTFVPFDSDLVTAIYIVLFAFAPALLTPVVMRRPNTT